jgi:RNA polymerase sigma factor (sigma-70 family)
MDSKERNHRTYLAKDVERQLIRDAQTGDHTARDELILAALPFAHRILRKYCPEADPDDFEDLAQDAVPILCDCISRYDLSHPAQARLYVFAEKPLLHAVTQHFRHQRLISFADEIPELVADDDPERSTEDGQMQRVVRWVLATLSLSDEDLLVSRFALDDATPRAAIAERYNCAPHVIEYAEKRAVKRFREALAKLAPKSSITSVN